MLILSRDGAERNHVVFNQIGQFLRPRSLVVLNDTRVIPARLAGAKSTGGRVEILLVERRSEMAPTASGQTCWAEDWLALARGLGKSRPGARVQLEDGVSAEVLACGPRGEVVLRFVGRGEGGLLGHAEKVGSIPLPPYIEAARKRDGESIAVDEDRVRYQTVYASQPGAVAAPTAGLHFTTELLDELVASGHQIARLTLHVGPGTFRPVTVEDPLQHRLDGERYEVSECTAQALRQAQGEGRPIVAVGTTVVRTLEHLALQGPIRAGRGTTQLCILPGHQFRVVTDLVTNFHLPRSSLLMLVSAFAGRDRVLTAYQDAIARGYRFYSYGDAMFIRPGSWS